jgi:YHS domain-containing protein
MTKHLILFIATFIAGAVIALTARTALHKPFTVPGAHVENAAYAPMVNNTTPTAPAAAPASVAPTTSVPLAPEPTTKPFNTICSVCGMEVDPDLPTATYQGKVIGFGCKTCPATFAANPELYGPAALRNEVFKK